MDLSAEIISGTEVSWQNRADLNAGGSFPDVHLLCNLRRGNTVGHLNKELDTI